MRKLEKIRKVVTPVLKDAAIGTAKLTGKGIKLAGKGVIAAGTKAVSSYKEKKAEQIESRVEELKEQYPDGIVLRSNDELNYSRLFSPAKVIFDQDNCMRYRIYGVYESRTNRFLSLYGQDNVIIGSVKEHSRLLGSDYVTVKYRNTILGDLYADYVFSDPLIQIEREGSPISTNHFLVRNLRGIMMEIDKVRGQEFIAVAFPDHLDECMLLYTAIDLMRYPKTESGK